MALWYCSHFHNSWKKYTEFSSQLKRKLSFFQIYINQHNTEERVTVLILEHKKLPTTQPRNTTHNPFSHFAI